MALKIPPLPNADDNVLRLFPDDPTEDRRVFETWWYQYQDDLNRYIRSLAINPTPIPGSDCCLSVKDFGAKGDCQNCVGVISAGFSILTQQETSLSVSGSSGSGVSPIRLDFAAPHGIQSGAYVKVSGVVGNTAANGDWIISVTSATSIFLQYKYGAPSVTSTGNGSYISGGSVASVKAAFSPQDVGKVITVDGAGVAGATLDTVVMSYVSYKQVVLLHAASTTVSGLSAGNTSQRNVVWGTDDTIPIQNAFNYFDASRNPGIEIGASTVLFPKGCYLVSGTLTVNFNRMRVKGAGSIITQIILKPGVTLAAPQNLPTAPYAQGLFASGPGLEYVKYGVFTSTRNVPSFSWGIQGIMIDGGDWHASPNNCGLCLYAMQQPGIIEDVFIANMGGSSMYFGYGDDSLNNPESSLFTIKSVECLWAGDTLIQWTHDAQVTFQGVNCERSLRGDGIQARGIFSQCHFEYTRYGIYPEVQGSLVSLLPQSQIMFCSGYANPAFIGDAIASVAFIYAPIYGATVENCSNVYYGDFAVLLGVTYTNEATFHQAVGSLRKADSWAITRNSQRGGFVQPWGTIPDIPDYICQIDNVLQRFALTDAPTWIPQLEMYATVDGDSNVLLFNPSVGATGMFVISFSGQNLFKFQDSQAWFKRPLKLDPYPLEATSGGTGRATLTNHGVLIGAGTSAISITTAGSAGHVLTSNGASADPTFQSPASSGVASLNTLTGALTLAAGANITLTPAGSTITIAATGASAVGAWTAFTPSLITNVGGPVTVVASDCAWQAQVLNPKQVAIRYTLEFTVGTTAAAVFMSMPVTPKSSSAQYSQCFAMNYQDSGGTPKTCWDAIEPAFSRVVMYLFSGNFVSGSSHYVELNGVIEIA